jgi:hypothetical protein
MRMDYELIGPPGRRDLNFGNLDGAQMRASDVLLVS